MKRHPWQNRTCSDLIEAAVWQALAVRVQTPRVLDRGL